MQTAGIPHSEGVAIVLPLSRLERGAALISPTSGWYSILYDGGILGQIYNAYAI